MVGRNPETDGTFPVFRKLETNAGTLDFVLMWLVAFLDVGGEWFLMWQSKMWNGQEEAFRMFTIVGVVFLVVVQREPTPD
jgi:predicted small integral membrane protein